MTFLLILLAVVVLLSAETVRLMFRDGRPARPPRSHYEDPRFTSPLTR